jgi:hypothetical protein
MAEFIRRRASKKNTKLRLWVDGPPGSGKTKTSIITAKLLIGEPFLLPEGVPSRIVVLDTERNSAELYADEFTFDVIEMPPGVQSPQSFKKALQEAEMEADVVILDSITHEWKWCLKEVDRLAKAKYKGNSWSAWSDVRPPHDEFVDAMMGSACHIIATARAKLATTQEKDAGGKTVVRTLGLEAQQDADMEFAFGIVLKMDVDNVGKVGKTRCSALRGREFPCPGKDFADEVLHWLNSGDASAETILTIEQAIDCAFRRITAAPGDAGKEERARATHELKQWCLHKQLPESDYQAAFEKVRAKVSEAAKKRAEAAAVAASPPTETSAQASSPAETPTPTSAPAEQGAAATA